MYIKHLITLLSLLVTTFLFSQDCYEIRDGDTSKVELYSNISYSMILSNFEVDSVKATNEFGELTTRVAEEYHFNIKTNGFSILKIEDENEYFIDQGTYSVMTLHGEGQQGFNKYYFHFNGKSESYSAEFDYFNDAARLVIFYKAGPVDSTTTYYMHKVR